MEKYDIFISYRRDGGEGVAGRISDKLSLKGYKVFYDVESLRSGKFNEQIFEAINHCSDVIVVLPQYGLDRCSDENDWVRLEIAYAIKMKKNIIPVLLRNFTFPNELPDDIAGLAYMQGVTAMSEYFDATMSRIENLLSCKIAKESVLQNETFTEKKIKIPFFLRTPVMRLTEYDFFLDESYLWVKFGHSLWEKIILDDTVRDLDSIQNVLNEVEKEFYVSKGFYDAEFVLEYLENIKKLDEVYLVPKRYRDDSVNPQELMYEISELAQTCFYNIKLDFCESYILELIGIGYTLIGGYSRLKGFPMRLIPEFCFKCITARFIYNWFEIDKVISRVSLLIQDSTNDYGVYEDAAIILNNRVKLFLKYFQFISMYLCPDWGGKKIKKYLLINYKYLKKHNVVLTKANEELLEKLINIYDRL